jgi:hypothetical protein
VVIVNEGGQHDGIIRNRTKGTQPKSREDPRQGEDLMADILKFPSIAPWKSLPQLKIAVEVVLQR